MEYFANETEDDIEDGIVGGRVVKPIIPEETVDIVGESFIKVKKTYEYIFTGENSTAGWSVDAKYPVLWEVDRENPQKISLKWNNTYSGQFEIKYGDHIKTIIVESLF